MQTSSFTEETTQQPYFSTSSSSEQTTQKQLSQTSSTIEETTQQPYSTTFSFSEQTTPQSHLKTSLFGKETTQQPDSLTSSSIEETTQQPYSTTFSFREQTTPQSHLQASTQQPNSLTSSSSEQTTHEPYSHSSSEKTPQQSNSPTSSSTEETTQQPYLPTSLSHGETTQQPEMESSSSSEEITEQHYSHTSSSPDKTSQIPYSSTSLSSEETTQDFSPSSSLSSERTANHNQPSTSLMFGEITTQHFPTSTTKNNNEIISESTTPSKYKGSEGTTYSVLMTEATDYTKVETPLSTTDKNIALFSTDMEATSNLPILKTDNPSTLIENLSTDTLLGTTTESTGSSTELRFTESSNIHFPVTLPTIEPTMSSIASEPRSTEKMSSHVTESNTVLTSLEMETITTGSMTSMTSGEGSYTTEQKTNLPPVSSGQPTSLRETSTLSALTDFSTGKEPEETTPHSITTPETTSDKETTTRVIPQSVPNYHTSDSSMIFHTTEQIETDEKTTAQQTTAQAAYSMAASTDNPEEVTATGTETEATSVSDNLPSSSSSSSAGISITSATMNPDKSTAIVSTDLNTNKGNPTTHLTTKQPTVASQTTIAMTTNNGLLLSSTDSRSSLFTASATTQKPTGPNLLPPKTTPKTRTVYCDSRFLFFFFDSFTSLLQLCHKIAYVCFRFCIL